jgi:hypothetical protein
MISGTKRNWAALLMLVAGVSLASVPPASAQTVPAD